MCGICGIINFEKDNFVQESDVKQMTNRMIYRGPDSEGIFIENNIGLGFRRLSIIDLSNNANQPMSDIDKMYWIVFNGEIYNFQEIKNDLKNKGYFFKSLSDTEVVLYSYIEYGKDCFLKFNGMFAVAIWDKKNKNVIFARDRFGKKPFFYRVEDNVKFVFASDINSLLANSNRTPKLSYQSINHYLALGYILNPLTIYSDIYQLEPSTYMLISEDGKEITKNRYWDYSESFGKKINIKESDITDNIKELLTNSIKRRMISDVPVGAFLSGGVDSSSVVSIMSRYFNELHTFSVGFKQKSYNELPKAERFSKDFNTIHHSMVCDMSNETSFMDEAIDSYDQLFADNSLIPIFEVSKLARKYVTVVLSGDGADEIFAGYPTYKADRLYNIMRYFPNHLKRLIYNYCCNVKSSQKLGLQYKAKQFFYGSLFNYKEAHYLWRIFFHEEERVKILGEAYRELIYDTDPKNEFLKYYSKVEDNEILDQHLYVDAMTWLTDDILVKVDRASMSNSLEVRCPYLDNDLVNYAASIPVELKLKNFNEKYILKKALKGIVPEYVLTNKKSGFNAPVKNWLKGNEGDEFKSFNKYVYNRVMNKIKI